MNNILIIGAGRSSVTLISFLLHCAAEHGWLITVADAQPALAEDRVKGHPNGLPVWLDVQKPNDRKDLIRRVDLVISMLPAHLHHLVAQDCLQLGKHLFTASYVSQSLFDIDQMVRDKDLLFLGEMGLDPGIDHMSAMERIDAIKQDGGKLVAFRSYAGGLIAPESDDNPWHYKVTWNPRNVVLAGLGTTQFLQDGKYKYIPYHQLFKRITRIAVPGLGTLDMYPNRDSLTYRKHYGLEGIPNLLRGTLRYPGYCQAWAALVELGLTDNTLPIAHSAEMRYRDFLEAFTDGQSGTLRERVAKQLDLDPLDEVMEKLAWLDLFSSRRIERQNATPAQILEDLIVQKWRLAPKDHDMVVLQHELDYHLDGHLRTSISTLILKGQDQQNTAMTKLVGLPLAIGAKLMMLGKIPLRGVQIPVHPSIYQPVLRELSMHDVAFTEKVI